MLAPFFLGQRWPLAMQASLCTPESVVLVMMLTLVVRPGVGRVLMRPRLVWVLGPATAGGDGCRFPGHRQETEQWHAGQNPQQAAPVAGRGEGLHDVVEAFGVQLSILSLSLPYAGAWEAGGVTARTVTDPGEVTAIADVSRCPDSGQP